MTMTFGRSTRSLLACAIACVVLAGCGAFGGDDDAASSPDVAVVEEVREVRVTAGDRFFDIDPASLLDADGELSPAAIAELEQRVGDLSLSTAAATNAGVFFEGGEFVVNPSVLGSAPDLEALAAALTSSDDLTTIDVPLAAIEAGVDDEAAATYAAQLNERISGGLEVVVGGETRTLPASVIGAATSVEFVDDDWVVSVSYEGIAEELNDAFPDVGTAGGNASFDIEPGEDGEPATVVIVPGPQGTACCGAPSADRIGQALMGEVDTARLSLAPADGELGVIWAENLGIQELVGSFTTNYTAGQSRNINIERIAELTQGMIIQPGDTWSLNEAVGQRTTEKGFVPAGTIINGHLSDSVGGGISQYATTLFNAAFFAGLEYGDYQAHSIYFSRYPYGREATISWPAPQLEIHNPTPYGILIWPTTTSNSITVDLYSTKWVDAEQTGQFESRVQVACTRVTTERTRTFLDGTEDVDTVFAIYREEGIGCNGEPTDDPDAPPTTTTTTTLPPDGQVGPDGEVDPNAPAGAPGDPAAPNQPNQPAPTPTQPAANPDAPAQQPSETVGPQNPPASTVAPPQTVSPASSEAPAETTAPAETPAPAETTPVETLPPAQQPNPVDGNAAANEPDVSVNAANATDPAA